MSASDFPALLLGLALVCSPPALLVSAPVKDSVFWLFLPLPAPSGGLSYLIFLTWESFF